MSRRHFRLSCVLFTLLGLVLASQHAMLLKPAHAASVAVAGDVALLAPTLVRSTGPELRWSRYPDTPTFNRYEIHRSRTPGFTTSSATLLTSIRDQNVTSWPDTTAAASSTFYYKIVVAGLPTTELSVTTPAAGTARLTVDGEATYLTTDRVDPVGCVNSANSGAATLIRTGPSVGGTLYRSLLRFDLDAIPTGATVNTAQMVLSYPATAHLTRALNVFRVNRAWKEGTGLGACDGSGATWTETKSGTAWTAPGGDATSIGPTFGGRDLNLEGANTVDLLGAVRQWTSGAAPNHGIELRYSDESEPGTIIGPGPAGGTRLEGGVGIQALPTGSYASHHSDDATDASKRPKLTVTFNDGSAPKAPVVALSEPLPLSIVHSATRLAATAGDDGTVTKVEFLVNGNVVGSDDTAPYEIFYDTRLIANGAWNVAARATDNAGHVTTSASAAMTVHNATLPTISVGSPANGAVVAGTAVAVSATPSATASVSHVEFYADSLLIGTDATSPYQATWNTLDAAQPMFDGAHQLTARVVLINGQTADSPAVGVTVANTAGTIYRAGFDLGAVGPADDATVLPPLTPDNNTLVPLDSVPGATGTSALPAAPLSGYPTLPPPMGPDTILPVEDDYITNAFPATVRVTNGGTVPWPTTLQLWYRWYTPDGVVLYEGRAANLPSVASGGTSAVNAWVDPPATPLGSQAGEIQLRFDVYDSTNGVWFSAKGNKPVDNPVIVNKTLENALGLERFWQYDADDAGAGMTTLTNVANGNMLLRWSPFFAPGRGLATMVDLTYNSLEDHSRSPAGNNFSLSMSGLVRLGDGLDLKPPHYVAFADGDGTNHRFTRVVGTDGIARWVEPPGVNLYLREVPTNPADRRWGLTRPDNVTFWFDAEGFPTAVVDRNGNTISFVLQNTPPGEDPGGPKKRIVAVNDPTSRPFLLDYYSKDEAKKAHIRGKLQRITDHSGSKLDFEYYEDGNLRRLIQRGGLTASGRPLADRVFVFTYTTSNGAGPAIPLAADRVNPDPRTPNQSSRIYSVRDPRGTETRYDYYSASEGAQLRWKLQSRTNRAGAVTSYGYDLTNRITTVTAPLSRVTRYTYDTTGKVTQIANALSQTFGVQWSPDFKVTRLTEPTGRFTAYTYNANGYLLSETNQSNERTDLTYVDTPVDAADTAARHLSLLSTVTKPRGTATPTVAGDYQWRYAYDVAGNIDRVTDPTGAVTDYDYSLAGSAHPGTIAAIKDANGNPPTTFPAYDPSGQPTEMRDPLNNLTRFGYTADGQVQWIQDPNHVNDTGTDVRSYRLYFDYDEFHRMGRQSAPKSTAVDRGKLIWSSVDFDANDNVVRRMDAHYGLGGTDPENGPVHTAVYDVMDQVTLSTNPDTSADPAGERTAFAYDAAGRMVKQTKPKGVQSTTVVDDFATVFAYDVVDRLARQTTFGASTSEARHAHFCYDVAGDMRSVTSPRARLGSVTCPGNGPAAVPFTQTFEYDPAHRTVKMTDPGGRVTRTGYDANSNVTLQERDIVTGRVQRTTVEHNQRDLPERVTELVDAATGRTAVTQISYDPNGNRSKVVSPRGTDVANGGTPTFHVTSFSYDALNRPITTTVPFGPADGTNRQFVHRFYDANGNVEWTSLPVATSDRLAVADTAKTRMTYFDPGWIRTSKDPRNPLVKFDYAAQGWQIERQRELANSPGQPDPDRRIGWEFYPDGQLKERKDFQGQPSTFAYDANNNLTSATDAAGLVDPGEKAVSTQATYTGFDEISKVRHRKQGETNWKFNTYTYDENGNTTVRLENGEESDTGTQTKAPHRHELTYDASDWLSVQLDLGTDSGCQGDQRIVNQYFANSLERQREFFRAGVGCVSDPLTWAKKQQTVWDYTDNRKMRKLDTTNSAGTLTESHLVSYHDDNGDYVNGHRTSDSFILKRAQGHGATECVGPARCLAKYEYDARDRLTMHQKRDTKITRYTFDEPDKLIGDTSIRAGNVTTENNDKGENIVRRYAADQNLELSVGGVTAKYWYDNDGNTDCLTMGTGTQADCNRPDGGGTPNLLTDYSYDYLSRLENMQQYSGGATTDKTKYTYDALDRTSQEVEDHNGAGTSKDRTTTFTYQGLTKQVTEEKQAGGSNPKTKQFSYDQYGHRIAMTDRENATGNEQKYSFSTDVHGSVSQLIDDGGNVRASYGYDAYGGSDAPSTDGQELTTGDTDQQDPVNPYRYSGRRMDSGSAASTTPPVPVGAADYDMGARRFGPDVQKFLQQDMFHGAVADLGLALDPLTQNRYALAGGNPISFVEFDGHFPSLSDIGDAIEEGVDKAADAVGDAVSEAGESIRSAVGSGRSSGGGDSAARGSEPQQKENPVRNWLNSERGQQARDMVGKLAEETQNAYGLIDNAKTLNSIVGRTLQDPKMPGFLKSASGKWLRNVAQDPAVKGALKFADSPLGKGIKRGAAGLSFGLDVLNNYAEGDKAFPAVAKAGIKTGGAIAGAKGGAALGGAIGTAIAPGVGTAVGGAIGGIAGGVVGGLAGEKVVEEFEQPIEDAAGAAQDFVGDTLGIG